MAFFAIFHCLVGVWRKMKMNEKLPFVYGLLVNKIKCIKFSKNTLNRRKNLWSKMEKFP